MKICFIAGSLGISGGTYVIFQHAHHLMELGHEVTIASMDSFDENTYQWHNLANKLSYCSITDAQKDHFDIVIATWWKTALELSKINASTYVYFVQSIESRFYSEKEKPLRNLINSTYDLPVQYITEADWIQDYLETHHGQIAHKVKNGIRKDLYRPDGEVIEGRPNDGSVRILVEGPMNVSFKKTGRALKLAKQSNIGEVWLLTGTHLTKIPKANRIFSQVPVEEVPSIYRSCDVLLKLSLVEGMFGTPLEMFHCGGTAVLYEVTGSEEYIKHQSNSLVSQPNDDKSILSYLKSIGKDPKKLSSLKESALDTAVSWPDWSESSTLFQRHLESLKPENVKDDLHDRIEDNWAKYVTDENVRLKRNPQIKIKYYAHSKLQGLPKGVQLKIREMIYAWECI